MNNSEPKSIIIQLDFLPEGKYKLNYFKDRAESNDKPTAIEIGVENVSSGAFYPIHMVKGGGFAAYIEMK
jgi:hypothetical protein